MNIEERLVRLEQQLNISVPGTIIYRSMKPGRGFEWGVAIGVMGMPKQFFLGDSIEEAIQNAEKELLK